MTELERLRAAVLHEMAHGGSVGSRRQREILTEFEAAVRADERAKYLADSGGRNQTHATGAGYRDE